ncbi:CD209 antigen-like protein 2 isoform X2 [Strongylocentrotus purpuratus]|uniref:C-type lectin domain-containing protein n=1 Tax=Strongylocentrotus purpuratus TaxID=7668 RepID=A0A7M7PIA7_STRPU|nr:CD209 antigen-like protein 2 isoform X2 [Strongylocentrotus purpuratus]
MFPIHILEGLIAFSILFLGRSCLSTESDVACPVGWTSFSSRCYFVMQSLYTWQGARDVCQGLGARVIEITTADENDFMVKLVDGVTFTSEDKAWLDCTNIGRSLNDWVCGPDDHELSYTYTNWKPNEPNNAGSEHCMEMYGTGIWNDKSCEAQNLAICESK